MILSTRRIVNELKKQLAAKIKANLTRRDIAFFFGMNERALEAREKRNASIAKELLEFCIEYNIDLIVLATTGKIVCGNTTITKIKQLVKEYKL